MRSLSLAHWIFHALFCFAVGLISHNAYESKSLDPPRENALVCAVSRVAHSSTAHNLTAWTVNVMNNLAHQLSPYRATAPSARASAAPAPHTHGPRKH